MKTITLTYSDKSTTYKVADESSNKPVLYRVETPDNIISILERCRKDRTRIKICLGDIETGRDWNETYDVTGYIGLSSGTDGKYPLLVHNMRSSGGGMLMSNCIVKIQESKGKRVLYQHPTYYLEV